MILRYFYIDKYNEAARDLDVNLGGKYRFHYQSSTNELKISGNKGYVNNLYEEYENISDVSAILGKNSAGKTTVLRMINAIFNGFDVYDRKQYIVLFERETHYIMYTNYVRIKYDESILDRKILCEERQYFNAIDILKDVGLIYFSNIFDRATPFQGNANLIDVSTNYLFENFYRNDIPGKIKRNPESTNLMDDYKSASILSEIDFLLDLRQKMDHTKVNLLFDVPTQIELGLSQVLPDFGNSPLCANTEYNDCLKQIYASLGDYLCENQESDAEPVSLFRREMIYYLLFDELCKFCREDKYDVLASLNCWLHKIKDKNWEISDYYQEILNKLGCDNIPDLTEGDLNALLNEAPEDEEESFSEMSFRGTWQDFEELCRQLNTTENINYRLIIYKMIKILHCKEQDEWKANDPTIRLFLKKAEYLLEDALEDLLHHDYDLYNIACINEAYEFVEKAYQADKIEPDSGFSIGTPDKAWLENSINTTEVMLLDIETENHLDLLKKVMETLITFTKQYEYDANANMLRVELNCQDILNFIYDFHNLECMTVTLDTRRNDISSGHAAYLDMCARINSARKSGEISRKKNVILLIDEGDIYLHPEKQLAYMDNLLKLLQLLYADKKVQLIFTSNSPFIISDIQTSNILYLEKEGDRIKAAKSMISNTFAANVNILLLDSFFVKNGLIGEYAHNKINNILHLLQNDDISEEDCLRIEEVIQIIGEPVIRRKLETMLLRNTPHSNVQKEIRYYENRLRQIGNHKDI